jgi:sugar phosphate isomerase/epimerase
MKLGVRAHDYGKHSVKDFAQLLKREGYKTVQLAIPKAFTGINSFDDITEDLLEEIRQEFTKNSIEIAVLGCYQDLGNPDKSIREAAVKTFKKALLHSKILGAQMVGTETSYARLSETDKTACFPFMMESIYAIVNEAEKLDAVIGIEPVSWHPLKDAETAAMVLNTVKSSHLKIILDPANIFPSDLSVSQDSYWKNVLGLLQNDIRAVHIKDFSTDKDGQYVPKPLGGGIMKFDILRQWILTKPDLPVLREEMNPLSAHKDISFLKFFQAP